MTTEQPDTTPDDRFFTDVNAALRAAATDRRTRQDAMLANIFGTPTDEVSD